MAKPHTRRLFLNLPVADLPRSLGFFAALGFELDPRFSNEQGACLVVNDGAFVMLLAGAFFETFSKRRVADAREATEVISAFSVGSRADVDAVYARALASGGSAAMDPQDHGFMYSRAFYDLDGHHWEVLWMDPSAVS